MFLPDLRQLRASNEEVIFYLHLHTEVRAWFERQSLPTED
jgi:hypothetical protein